MFSEKYPQTGLQRETGEVQREHIAKMRESFFGNPYDEARFTERVASIFRLQEAPTPEEVEDIRIFAEHALPRLASSALQQPSFKAWFHNRAVPEAQEQSISPRDLLDERLDHTLAAGAPLGWRIIGHDIIHASVAYLNSRGKKLRPRYNDFENRPESASRRDLEAVLEETIVMVFQGELAPPECLSWNFSPSESLEEWLEKKTATKGGIEQIRSKFGELGEELLKESLSYQSLLRYIELLGVYLAADDSVSLEIAKIMKEKRPSYLVEVVKSMCDNAVNENPDPNILLHEWLRLMEPLLKRLRNKKIS